MSELATISKNVVQPLPLWNGGEAPAFAADAAVDTSMMENSINHMQKVAGYVDTSQYKKTGFETTQPQLREPTVQQSDFKDIDPRLFKLNLERLSKEAERMWDAVENQVELLTERVIGQFEAGQQYNEALKAEMDKRWQEFEHADSKLSLAQAKVEEVIELFTQLQAKEEPTEAELQMVAKAFSEALEQVKTAVNGLDAKFIGLVATTFPDKSERTIQSQIKLSVLEECLYRLQQISFADKKNTIESRSEVSTQMKKGLIDYIRASADKQREIDDAKDFWMSFWKWTGVALAGIVAFTTGGMGGFFLGLITAAVVVSDLASDGQITAKIFEPLIEVIGPALEKALTALMDHLVEEKGYDETEAIGITMAIFFGAALLPTLVTGGGGVAIEKIGETAVGKVIGESIKKIMGEIVESSAGKLVGAIIEGIQDLFDAFISKTGIKAIEEGYKKFLTNVLGIEGMEAYIYALMQVQTAASFIGVGLEGFFSIKGALAQQEGQELSAEITLARADDDIISDEMKNSSDLFANQLQTSQKFFQLLSQLMASKENTMATIYRNMRA